MSRREGEDLERNFGFLLVDVARLLKTSYDRRVRELDLTRSQWWVLNHLFRHEGIRQSELAELLEIERAALGRLIDRLESNGWVRREQDPNDRRAKQIYLTDEVAPIVNTMRRKASELRQDATRGLSEKEQKSFVDTLLQIKANLNLDLNSESGNSDLNLDATKTETSNAKPAMERTQTSRQVRDTQ